MSSQQEPGPSDQDFPMALLKRFQSSGNQMYAYRKNRGKKSRLGRSSLTIKDHTKITLYMY